MPPPFLPSPQDVALAALAGDGATVLEAAQAYLDYGGLALLADALVQPALACVGERWCRGRASVAEEHAVTGLMREVLGALMPSLSWQRGGPRAVVACVSGERHELGAQLAAHLLALDGWNVRFLGADTPAGDLGDMVAELHPSLVGLSLTLPERLPAAWYTIAHLRRLAPACHLVAGGRAARALLRAGAPVRPDAVVHSAGEVLGLARGWTPQRGSAAP